MADLHIVSTSYLLQVTSCQKQNFFKRTDFVYKYKNYNLKSTSLLFRALFYTFTYTTCSHLQVIDKPVVVKLCLLHVNRFRMNSNQSISFCVNFHPVKKLKCSLKKKKKTLEDSKAIPESKPTPKMSSFYFCNINFQIYI